MLASLGPALLMTALNVKYRDFRYIIPFVVQFGALCVAGRIFELCRAREMALLV